MDNRRETIRAPSAGGLQALSHIEQLVFFEISWYQPVECYIPKNHIFPGEQKRSLVFLVRVR